MHSVAGCALTTRPPARPGRFALPHPHQPLGLPIGQHISLRAEDEDSGGPMLLRPYTPVSTLEQTGLVDFVIKARPRPRPALPRRYYEAATKLHRFLCRAGEMPKPFDSASDRPSKSDQLFGPAARAASSSARPSAARRDPVTAGVISHISGSGTARGSDPGAVRSSVNEAGRFQGDAMRQLRRRCWKPVVCCPEV